MQSYQSGKVADQYLLQRIEGATPELLHAMLLEAGQKFLKLAIAATETRDISAKSKYFSRVTEIIVELSGRLNHEDGGEVVQNLIRIYNWWIDLIFDASQKNEPDRLRIIDSQMGEMRATWEELHQKKVNEAQPAQARSSLDGLVG